MVRLYPFKAVKPQKSSDLSTTVPEDNWDLFCQSPRSACEVPSFSPPKTSALDGNDIYDSKLSPGSSPPVMVVSPDRALCTRLNITLDTLRNFIDFGLLSQEPDDSFYIYSISHGDHVQIGVCAAVAVEDYRQGIIKRHEKTTSNKGKPVEVQNRTIGPIMAMYRESKDVNAIVNEVLVTTPQVCVESDSIIHRIWSVNGKEEVEAIQFVFASVDCLYIADGHHRAANASKAYVQDNPLAQSHIMAVVFPHTQLRILPYHRCLRTIGDRSMDQFMDYIQNIFHISPLPAGCDPQPVIVHKFSMYTQNRWYSLTPKDAISDDDCNLLKSLDVQILFDRLLQPLLDVKNCRTDSRIMYVAGCEGVAGLENLVHSGEAVVAFCLKEISVETVMRIADANLLLPPKATWFDPKLLSGLLVPLT